MIFAFPGLYSNGLAIFSNISKFVGEYESSYGIGVDMHLKLSRQIIEILGFVMSVGRSSVPLSNSTRAQDALQTKLDEMSVLIEMRKGSFHWTYFSLNSSETTRSIPVQGINRDQQRICDRLHENTNDIESRLRWLTEPDQLEQDNYTMVIEETLQRMVMTVRDEKLCYNFYGNLLISIQNWLNEVNVSRPITLDTYDFELMSQVRINKYTRLDHARYLFYCIVQQGVNCFVGMD